MSKRPQWVVDWLTALKSGKYPKGKGWLNQGGNFCCLGVLCELQNVPKILNGMANITYYDGSCMTVPHWLKIKLGLADSTLLSLIRRNDNPACDTFAEVIVYIEETYPE